MTHPCSEERCDYVWVEEAGDYGCLIPKAEHPIAFGSPHAHEFAPHTHTPECDARWWREVMGCEPKFDKDGVLFCARSEHLYRCSGWAECAPVLSGTAWEGVPVMLKETIQRGLNFTTTTGPEGHSVRLSGWAEPWAGKAIYFNNFDGLPRALAEALWEEVTND